jgi:hypothetical protein
VQELGEIFERTNLDSIVDLQLHADGIIDLGSTDHRTRVSTIVDQPEPEPVPQDMRAASFEFFR